MTLPNRYDVALLILRELERGSLSSSIIIDRIADRLDMTPRDSKISVAVRFAKSELRQAGLISYVENHVGLAEITERGRDVLSANPVKLDRDTLENLKKDRGEKRGVVFNTLKDIFGGEDIFEGVLIAVLIIPAFIFAGWMIPLMMFTGFDSGLGKEDLSLFIVGIISLAIQIAVIAYFLG